MQRRKQDLPAATPAQTPGAKPERPAAPKPVPPPEFQSARIDKLAAAELAALLSKGDATTFEKAKACQRLAVVGTAESVPALAALLTDPQLSHYARYGLEPIPSPAADDALRAALPKVKGRLLVGVLNSIAVRQDAKAALPVAKLLYDADPEVAVAAAAALGHISGAQAAKSLEDALGRTKGAVRNAVADGALVCAERLLARGERDQALALYTALTATSVPKPVRLGAMHGIISAETSLKRPR